MKAIYSTIFAVAMISFVQAGVTNSDQVQRAHEKCTQTRDCATGSCCFMTSQRFSVPGCLPMQKEGDVCQVGQSHKSGNYWYPDGSTIEVTEVYFNICPCDSGLFCNKGTCQRNETNTIF